jgi:uncharacterized SAM-binding protein YcdF (DUF218 family)
VIRSSIQNGFAAIGLLLLLVTLTPLTPWWARKLAGAWDDPRGDVLIVPAGPALADGTLGSSSYWRSVYAARSYKDGFRAVILTGGEKSAAMRDFIVYLGAPREAIRIETESSGTRENALYSRALIDAMPGRKVLLTSDYHMFRAYRTFQKAGIDVAPRPFPDVLKMSSCRLCRWQAFVTLLDESAKIAYYYVRGWI